MAPSDQGPRVLHLYPGRWSPGFGGHCGVQLDTSTSARLQSWQEAMRDLVRHPVLGFGVTGYRFVDAQYVRVAAETGLLGLLLFLLLLATILRESYRVFKASHDPFDKGLTIVSLQDSRGFCFTPLARTLYHCEDHGTLWFIAAMVMMIHPSKRTERVKGRRQARKARRPVEDHRHRPPRLVSG